MSSTLHVAMVDTHHYRCQTLTRAVPAAQDNDPLGWLQILYPIRARLTAEMTQVSTQMACAEPLLSGCITDLHPVSRAPPKDSWQVRFESRHQGSGSADQGRPRSVVNQMSKLESCLSNCEERAYAFALSHAQPPSLADVAATDPFAVPLPSQGLRSLRGVPIRSPAS